MLKSIMSYRNLKVLIILLLLIVFCWCGNEANAQIKTAATWSTFTSEPVVFGTEVKGGHHQVLSIAARNAIPEAKREWGMFCTVYDVSASSSLTTYQLVPGAFDNTITENKNWVEFAAGGSSTVSGDETKIIGSTNISISGTGTDDDKYEISLVGDDTNGYTITKLKTPTNDSDAATKKYVDDKVNGKVYFGSLGNIAVINAADITTLANVLNESNGVYENLTFTGDGDYFVMAVPSSWRTPNLKIDNDDTLNVFVPVTRLDINNDKYIVWSTNIKIPNPIILKIK